MKKRLFIIATVLVLLGIGFFVYSQMNQPENVLAYQLKKQDVVASLTVTGEVRARNTVEVSPPITARIIRMLVDDGDMVRIGQTIAELDPQDVEATLAESQARLAQAQASLEFVEQGTRPEQIERLEASLAENQSAIRQSQAAYEAAQSRLRQAQNQMQRMAQLYREQVLSAQEYEQYVTQRDVAQREVDRLQAEISAARSRQAQTQQQLTEARRGPTLAERAQAQAARNAAAQAVQAAQARLRDRFIESNINGIVLDRVQETGEIAMPGKSMVRMADWATIELIADVEEADLGRVSLSDTAYILLDAQPDTPLKGVVHRIGAEVNPDNGTVEVTIKMLPQDKALPQGTQLTLLPGMTADISIITGQLQDALVLPATAVSKEGGRYVAYIFQDGKLSQRIVQGRRVSLEYFEVTSGLEPGTWVARFANSRLLEKRNAVPMATPIDSNTPIGAKPPTARQSGIGGG